MASDLVGDWANSSGIVLFCSIIFAEQTPYHIPLLLSALLLLQHANAFAQADKRNEKVSKASKKIEEGIEKGNTDTLALGYYELGESFYNKGELVKSEGYYQKAKTLYEKMDDAEGIAKAAGHWPGCRKISIRPT